MIPKSEFSNENDGYEYTTPSQYQNPFSFEESPMKQEIYRIDSSGSMENEWTNIQDVIKSTFRAMHQVIVEQQQAIHQLNHQFKTLSDRLATNEENTNKKLENASNLSQKKLQSEVVRIEDLIAIRTSEHDRLAQEQRDFVSKLEQKLDLKDFDSSIGELRREFQFLKSDAKQTRLAFEDNLIKKLEKSNEEHHKNLKDVESVVETRIGNLHTMIQSRPNINQILKEVESTLVDPKHEELSIELNTLQEQYKNKFDIISKSLDGVVKDCQTNKSSLEILENNLSGIENKVQNDYKSQKLDLEKYIDGQQRAIRQEIKSQMMQIDHEVQGKIAEVKQLVHTEVSSSTSKMHTRILEEFNEIIEELKATLQNKTSGQMVELKKDVQSDLSLAFKELDIIKGRVNDEFSDVRTFFLNKFDDFKERYAQKSEMKTFIHDMLSDRIGEAVNTLNSQWKNKLDDKVDYIFRYINDANESTMASVRSTVQSFVEKTEIDNIVRTLEESLKASFDLHQQGKRSLVALKESVDTQWSDNQDKLTLIFAQLEKHVKVEELSTLLEKKADVRTLNQWIQQHTKDVNDVLDMKANFDELIVIKEELKKKVDEVALQEIRKEISSMNELRAQVSSLSTQITNDFVDKQTLREINHDIIARVDKKVGDYSQSLSQHLRDLTIDLQNKVDRNDMERQLRLLNEKKMGREDLLSLRDEFLPTRDAVSNCVTLHDFRLFTNSVQQELKTISNSKLDTSEYNVLATSLKNYLTRREVDSILDSKISSLRRSIDTLHRSIGQLLVTSNSSIQKSEPKIPKTPHVQNPYGNNQ